MSAPRSVHAPRRQAGGKAGACPQCLPLSGLSVCWSPQAYEGAARAVDDVAFAVAVMGVGKDSGGSGRRRYSSGEWWW